jgi:hypothetical protein
MNRRQFIAGASVAAAASLATPVDAAPNAPTFSFSSSASLSLHHTLYRQAGALLAYYSGGPSALGGLQRRFYDEITAVPSSDRPAWYRALSEYGNHYSGRSFIFDDEMARIENELSDGKLPASLSKTLESVFPIYLRTFWTAHDAANQHWIAEQRNNLNIVSMRMASRLRAIYGTPWMRVPYRVEAVPSTDRDSAFSNVGTNNGYFLIVASSMDRDLAGWKGLETIYHEASHSVVDPSIPGIAMDIAAAAASLNRPVPTDLWHALIMYTPAAVLRPLLAARGVTTFVSTFDGLLTNVYPRYNDAFKEHWQPYIDGTTSRVNALRAVVSAVTG